MIIVECNRPLVLYAFPFKITLDIILIIDVGICRWDLEVIINIIQRLYPHNK